MQTIIGAGGAIGIELAKALKRYTNEIRLVSRHPKKVNETDELFAADVTDAAELDKAIEGSAIVYLTVGFEYKLKIWQKNWPALIGNMIASCKKHQAKLVFFDNIYMYDKKEIPHMTENSSVNPCAKKGKVRAAVAQLILDEIKNGTLTALIARSADFYGPGAKNNITQIIIEDLKKGKKASWLVSADKLHNFTYTPDAGAATALLGNTPNAYNQVWHLPTSHEKITGKEWIDMIAGEMKTVAKLQVLPVWLMTVLGVFMPQIKELKDIVYQSDRDYFFDSSKFEKRFEIKPTLFGTGIRETVKSFI
ncbi:MAG: NAD-dependent epimerase/dehydratase family protein [Bacteroidota bacterium]